MERSPPKPRVDIIVNRVAKHLAEDGPLLDAIHSLASRAPATATVRETRGLAELEGHAADLAARGTDCVILAGGDGSYMAGTTALAKAFGEELPQIGFAPGGTVGTVARNWGYRGDRVQYTRRLIEATLAGRAASTRRPTLRIEDDEGGRHIGFIFGAGLVAHFFDAYYEAAAPGYAAAAALVAKIFVGSVSGGALAKKVLSPIPCKLIVDRVSQPSATWSLIAASVVRDLGLHVRLLHRAGEQHDAFHAVASALPAHFLGPQLPLVLASRPIRGRGHVDRLTRELAIEYPVRSTYVLDGDRLRARSVTVTPGPVLDYVTPSPP